MMRATVFKAPAGLGKTDELARQIAEARFGVFEVYAATLALAEEWHRLILQYNPNKRVSVIRGRDQLDGSGAPLCQRILEAKQLSKAGCSIYGNLCHQSQGKNIIPITCPHIRTCAYLDQFGFDEVYIYTHAHLRLTRGPREFWQPACVVIDEAFFQSCIEHVKLNVALLTHPSLPPDAKVLCRDVANCFTSQTPHALQAIMKRRGSSGMAATLKALDNNRPQTNPGTSPHQLSSTLKTFTSFAAVRTLLAHLKAELTVRSVLQAVDFNALNGEIVIHVRHKITRFKRVKGRQPQIIILDASASRQVIEQYFQIENFHAQSVARNSYVIQCQSTRCSTTSLAPHRNKHPKSIQEAQRRLDKLNDLIKRMCTDHRRVLVVGPGAIVGNPNDPNAPPSLITAPANCELAHFNALRGIDRWKDFDAVLIVGRNQPTVEVVQDMARALYFDDPQPLTLTGMWDSQKRGYRTTGQLAGVDVHVHADARVQAVLEQVREHENLQGVDRLRHLHSKTVKTVIILSNIPLDIQVDETRSWDELMDGTRLEQAWAQLDGVLPLNAAWLSTRRADLWASVGAAKKDVARGSKKGHFSNSSYIRKVAPFEYSYRHAVQRQWSRCLSRSDDLAWVKCELEALTGSPVTVKVPRRPR